MIAIWEEVLKTVSEFSEEEQKILVSRWLREVKMPDFIKIIRDEVGEIFFGVSGYPLV